MTSQKLIYECTELKLSSLIISEIPDCSVEVIDNGNSLRKIIRITYPAIHENDIKNLERAFLNKEAITNIYSYNKALNLIRDELRRGNEKNIFRRTF
jgi:hypothetical protein